MKFSAPIRNVTPKPMIVEAERHHRITGTNARLQCEWRAMHRKSYMWALALGNPPVH